MTALASAAEYAAWVAAPAGAVWFSAPDCGVCRVLGPRLETLFAEEFPELPLACIDAGAHPELAAQAPVFGFPTLAVFFDGREFVRRSRNFSISELARELERPYHLWLGARA